MKRTTIRLEEEQVKKLDYHSRRTGIPVSVIIRKGIDAELQKMAYEEKQLSTSGQPSDR